MMDNITVLNMKNYPYRCYNCGSDSEDASIRIEMKAPDHNFSLYFDLCPKCAFSISSTIREYADRMLRNSQISI